MNQGESGLIISYNGLKGFSHCKGREKREAREENSDAFCSWFSVNIIVTSHPFLDSISFQSFWFFPCNQFFFTKRNLLIFLKYCIDNLF